MLHEQIKEKITGAMRAKDEMRLLTYRGLLAACVNELVAKKRKPVRKVVRKVATNCVFCNADREPDYKDYTDLAKFLSERARILGKDLTGICSMHQRALSREIKRARHLGLLPYSPL